MNKYKCKCDDCSVIIEEPFIYCSVECACYDGAYSITKGTINQQKIDKYYAVLADN